MTIGILPCAGKAERFNGLYKWQLPVSDATLMEHHCNQMIQAGCDQVCVGANPENFWQLQNQVMVRVYQAFQHETMTQTVMSLQPLLTIFKEMFHDEDGMVLFGMPDTYIHMEGNPYEGLVNILENSPNLDLLVGCWQPRPNQWQQGGMVVFEQGDCIQAVIDKPEAYPEHSYIWGVMAWRPAFWECLEPDMPHVGYGIMKAVEKGLKVNAVLFKGDYYDCGDFSRYAQMIRNVTSEPE